MNKIAQWGTVSAPAGLGSDIGNLQSIIGVVLKTLIMGAGIYAVINILLAGYAFISASGDPKRISDASSKIWHSVLGFVIAAGAFVIAGIIGQILFGDPDAILQLKYFTPITYTYRYFTHIIYT